MAGYEEVIGKMDTPDALDRGSEEIRQVVRTLRAARENGTIPPEDVDVSTEAGEALLELLGHMRYGYADFGTGMVDVTSDPDDPVHTSLLRRVMIVALRLGMRLEPVTRQNGTTAVRRVYARDIESDIDSDLIEMAARIASSYANTKSSLTKEMVDGMEKAVSLIVDSLERSGVPITMSTVVSILIGATLQDSLRRHDDPEYRASRPEPEPHAAIMFACGSLMSSMLDGEQNDDDEDY